MFWIIALLVGLVSLALGVLTGGATLNYEWYLLSLVLFSMAYWFTPIHNLLALPSLLAIPLLTVGASLNRVLRVPLFIIGHLLGTTWLAFVWATGVALITLHFSDAATNAWLYLIVGGIASLVLATPNGETSMGGTLESFGVYLIWVSIPGTLVEGLVGPVIIVSLFFIFAGAIRTSHSLDADAGPLSHEHSDNLHDFGKRREQTLTSSAHDLRRQIEQQLRDPTKHR